MADQYGVEPGEVLSLDGKTLRGIHGEEIPGVHLVSAYAVRGGAVLAQAAAPGKGQELEAAKEVLGLVPLQGRVVVADALLTQREVCEQIVAGGGDYLLPVKRRELWAFSDPELNGYAGSAGTVGAAWPHLQQVCRVERRRAVKGKIEVAVSYAVTSLPPTAAGADRLLQILREHWHIENRVHWVRDVTFDEDRSQIRTASAPQVMAALRNLTTTLVRWVGHSNIAAALRRHAAHLSEALALLGIACNPGK